MKRVVNLQTSTNARLLRVITAARAWIGSTISSAGVQATPATDVKRVSFRSLQIHLVSQVTALRTHARSTHAYVHVGLGVPAAKMGS